MSNSNFHVTFFPANDVWPAGGWSIYRINGDQIAQRIVFDPVTRKVVERHCWSGFLGCYASLDEVASRIREAMKTD